jgi:hypothetical protein
VQQAALVRQQMGMGLSAVTPPAADHAAHRRLIRLQHRRAAALFKASGDVQRARRPRAALRRVQRRLARRLAPSIRKLRGRGYDACL